MRRIFYISILQILCVFTIFSQESLTINYQQGKDDLYKHPATFTVQDNDGKMVKGATVYLDEIPVGITNDKGSLTTHEATKDLVKYTLTARKGNLYTSNKVYHVQNSDYPSLVFTNFGKDSKTSVSFTWHTDPMTKLSVVEYVPADDKQGFESKAVKKETGNSYIFNFTDVAGNDSVFRPANVHKAMIGGLIPGTKYIYRVGNGSVWEIGTFQTAFSSGPFRFLFIPDTQEYDREKYMENWGNILKTAFDLYPDIRFMVHAGDMVQGGKSSQEWEWFYQTGKPYFKRMQIEAIMGNHESGGTKSAAKNIFYNQYFNNPSNGTKVYAEGSAYTFNYSNMDVLVLDMTSFAQLLKKENDLVIAMNWIEGQLKKMSEKNWRFVMEHQSIYAVRRDYKKECKLLAPLFEKYKIHLVISGHDHVYLRTDRLKYDEATNDAIIAGDDAFGTTYIISGSGCRKIYNQEYAKPYHAVIMSGNDFEKRDPRTLYRPFTTQNFIVFDVQKDEGTIKCISKEGELLDECHLKR